MKIIRTRIFVNKHQPDSSIQLIIVDKDKLYSLDLLSNRFVPLPLAIRSWLLNQTGSKITKVNDFKTLEELRNYYSSS